MAAALPHAVNVQFQNMGATMIVPAAWVHAVSFKSQHSGGIEVSPEQPGACGDMDDSMHQLAP